MKYFQGTFDKRCRTTGAPTHLSFFTTTFSLVFLILNIPGNLLVILAVAIDPYKNLRTPFNYLMTNLAVADLIVGAVADSISVYVHIKEGLNEPVPDGEIQAVHMSYFISCTASVLSLSSLAVERYLAIRDPHTYRNKVTGKRILLTVACIWLISLTVPFVYFEVGYITYAFIFANTTIAVAVFITCFTYTMMLYKFRERTKDHEPPATSDKNLNLQESVPAQRSRDFQWEQKITKMFLVVLIALLCCYGPSTIFIYIMSFCESCRCNTLHWFRDLQFLLVIMNSSLNFFCYALRSPRFRKAFAYILRIRRRNQNEQARGSGT